MTDCYWLFGALQGALLVRGRQIVRYYEHVADGIAVWHQFLATYRFGGNIQLYLAEQRAVLVKKFSLNYPGGAIGFLED